MNLDELVNQYFDTKNQIHEAMGYHPDWAEMPLDDQRDAYWMLVGGEGHGGTCVRSQEPFTETSLRDGKTIYSGPIYTQRHLPKWVYRTETHVLVCVDTETDLNRVLMIFRADRECTDERMRKTWKEAWG